MKKVVLFFLLGICALSCTHQNSYTGSAKDVYVPLIHRANTSYPPTHAMRNCMDTIYLETNDSCLLGYIKDIRIDNDLIFINSNNQIYLFNTEGKYLRSFDSRGRGPGEYLNIWCFDLLPEKKELYVLDRDIRKVLVYSYDKTFIRAISVDDYPFDFAVLKNGNFLFYYPQNPQGQVRRGLWRSDSNGVLTEQLIKLDPNFKRISIIDHFMVHIDEDTVGLMGLQEKDVFYKITCDTIYESYHMTTDFKMSRKVYKCAEGVDAPLKTYVRLNYLESLNWLMFILTDGVSTEAKVFVDKQNDMLYRLYNNDYLQYVNGPEDLIPFYNNSFRGVYASYIEPSVICNVPEVRDKYFPLLKADDNPVLIVMRDN